jgi:hypothetical protein
MFPGDDEDDTTSASSPLLARLSPADRLMARAIHAAPSGSLWEPARRVDLDALARLRLMGWQWDTIYRELVLEGASSEGSAALLRSATLHPAGGPRRRPRRGWLGARGLAVAVLSVGVVTVTLSGAFCRFQIPPPQAALTGLGARAAAEPAALASPSQAPARYVAARMAPASGAAVHSAARPSARHALVRALVSSPTRGPEAPQSR